MRINGAILELSGGPIRAEATVVGEGDAACELRVACKTHWLIGALYLVAAVGLLLTLREGAEVVPGLVGVILFLAWWPGSSWVSENIVRKTLVSLVSTPLAER